MDRDYRKGRGSQIQTKNPYLSQEYVTEHWEGLDEELLMEQIPTQILYETPKKIVNKVESPDVGMAYSLNPYQGCEHGCIYCYARKTHEYWGYNAGLDFETKIIVKKNAPELLEKHFLQKSWKPETIMLSGNTDCYQPIERKLGITRKLLEVFLKYRNPVGIISKNVTMLRDLDILSELAKLNLVRVTLSITSLDEKLRSKLEPRTASAARKLKAIEQMTKAGVPVSIMNAPIIPGLNHHEIPQIIKAAADHGAVSAGYTVVRLNGYIGEVFEDWLRKNFPDRFDKVWNQICEVHGGNVNDSEFGRRMRGSGQISDIISQLFHASVERHMKGRHVPTMDTSLFRRGGHYKLF
ncbi:PA0069 family radical SAM protein [Fulvivirga sediminis]|uniref:PA0069 family radical SAM protein n=1 Tax=Fulvivirga sediminis TaxID=2803949 RepID=A0A937F5W9_9BACT|nr:PA0069 family radical SAM protein [Fulvivirga sediminis]MBL3654688.1 PA0069 family radical SAM protein [Fulvivirga sediminis]